MTLKCASSLAGSDSRLALLKVDNSYQSPGFQAKNTTIQERRSRRRMLSDRVAIAAVGKTKTPATGLMEVCACACQ
jgi:hypothetical protein